MSVQNLADTDVAALKIFYEESYVDAALRNNPAFSLLTKDTHGGQQVAQTVKVGLTGAAGPDFTQAFAALSNSMQTRKQFFFPWTEHYALDQIPQLAIDLASESSEAIVDLLADGLEGTQTKCSNNFEKSLFNDGFGVIGTISSSTGGGPYVLTLTNASDGYNFGINDILVTSTTSTAALDTGSITVNAVNNDPVSTTISVTANGGWTPTNAHVIFNQAAKVAGSLAVPQWLNGFSAWLPLAAPIVGGGDSFGGLDRSINVAALAGRRVDGRNMPIKKAINLGLAALAVDDEARPDTVFMNPLTWVSLEEDVQSSAIVEKGAQGQGDAVDVYFDTIRVKGPKGNVNIVSAWGCPQDRLFIITKKLWKLHNAPGGKNIRMGGKMKDGIIDLISADGVQLRSRAIGQLTCSYPGGNCVVRLA